MEGILRIYDVSRDDGIAGILLFCFMLISVAFIIGETSQIFSLSRLFSTKERTSIFSKSSLIDEKFNATLLIQLMLSLGILIALTAKQEAWIVPRKTLAAYAIASSVGVGLYLIVWLHIIEWLGKLFDAGEEIKLWIRDFITLAGATGILLYAILIITIYVKGAVTWGIGIGFFVLLLFKFATIYKGIRLFFNNIYSILYLILYLCAFEIIPLLLLRKGMMYLVEMINPQIITL